MTIEQKALELVNAERFRRGWFEATLEDGRHIAPEYVEALCRAIEAHESDKSRHAAELREQAERFSEVAKVVHDAVPNYFIVGGDHGHRTIRDFLSPFILAKPDPLEESLADALCRDDCMVEPAERLRAALDARGLAIVKKEAVNG